MPRFAPIAAVACPEPHIERWFFADPAAFQAAVGSAPAMPSRKCERGYYKRLLSNAVTAAGHPATLGGIEFARDLVEKMNLYEAGKAERSLKAFLDELESRLG